MENKVILIADDAAFMRKMIKKTLASMGLETFLEATNGIEAVEMYRTHQPDLVFLDVTMPEKSGLEALKEIMAMNGEAKVIMCSAIGQDGTIMEAIRAGASEFVVKPFKKEQVLEIVTSLI